MNALANEAEQLSQLGTTFDKSLLSISITEIKKNIPRVNFKKIKLAKLNDFDDYLKTKSVTRLYLDDRLLEMRLPIIRQTTEASYELENINPLRKKIDNDEVRVEKFEPTLPVSESLKPKPEEMPRTVELESEEHELSTLELKKIEPEEAQLPVKDIDEFANMQSLLLEEEEEPVVLQGKKDITFNLEAEVVQEEENIIHSPATLPIPPPNEDVISSSGELAAVVWPPVKEKKQKSSKPSSAKAKKKKKKSSGKAKPYFLSEKEGKTDELQQPVEENKSLSDTADKVQNLQDEEVKTPWSYQAHESLGMESVFKGGLESELVDSPSDKEQIAQEITPLAEPDEFLEKFGLQNTEPIASENINVLDKAVIEVKPSEIIQPFRAFAPKIQDDVIEQLLKEQEFNNIKTPFTVGGSDKVNFGVGTPGKVEKMFDKSGKTKITPMRIIIFGGLTATLGYLIWNQMFSNLINYNSADLGKEEIVVRDLFKQSHKLKNDLKVKKEISYETTKDLNEKLLSPITEGERLKLIEQARESLEERLDPFGQELPPPSEVPADSGKGKGSKALPEVNVQRKQVELVGVISLQNKNLALVNIYTADYGVSPNDDKKVREEKLKTALGMAVPNRLEVSVLDPVEDWNIRVINKSKSRSDDPTIELVRGDKKFKLKVGQKVLLPEDKPLPEYVPLESESDKNDSEK